MGDVFIKQTFNSVHILDDIMEYVYTKNNGYTYNVIVEMNEHEIKLLLNKFTKIAKLILDDTEES